MVLYGYVKAAEKDVQPKIGVALSGLRIGELSYGKLIGVALSGLRIGEFSYGKLYAVDISIKT